jgi:cytochrome c553
MIARLLRLIVLRQRSLTLWIAATAAMLLIGAVLFAWSGIYNVSASREHFGIMSAFLELALRSSVRTHSLRLEAPMLEDENLIVLGAGHFESGCAPCHGSPLRPRLPPYENMLPAPPELRDSAKDWSEAQLFWIVRNGFKYTGMPSWPAYERGDEVWAVVAFLKRYATLRPEDYSALIQPAGIDGRTSSEAVKGGEELVLCIRCHGDEGTPPSSRLVPRLAGQSRRYMEVSLTHYAVGARASGIMASPASRLDQNDIARVAEYYSAIQPEARAFPRSRGEAAQIARGHAIATQGDRGELIPPCLACHNPQANENFPRLAGQSATYVAGQLRLFKDGLRDRTVLGAIMTPIAQRLSEQQIDDVAAYFESAREFQDAGHVPL